MPKYEVCAGTGRTDAEVVVQPLYSEVIAHEYPGRAICPVCGKRCGYRINGGIAIHKAAERVGAR